MKSILSDATVDASIARGDSNLIKAPDGLIGTAGNSASENRKKNQLISIDDEDGLTSHIEEKEYLVLVGNRKWIKEKNFIDIPKDLEQKLLIQEKRGHTAILAAIDGIHLHFITNYWRFLNIIVKDQSLYWLRSLLYNYYT